MTPCNIELYDIPGAKALDLPWPDIYETPGYAEADLCTQGPGTTWELAVWKQSADGVSIAYGYFKRPVLIKGKIVGQDLSTCYGYAAPFATSPVTPEVWAAFRQDFTQLCNTMEYAAEFIRFSPLRPEETNAFIEGCSRVSPALLCWHHQNTVAIQLDSYWERAAKNHRRSVKKAQNLGYTVELRLATLSDVAADSPFYQLYEHTMQRVRARDSYFFPADYYSTLIKSLPSDCLYIVLVRPPFEAETHEINRVPSVVAASLYFHHGPHFHYHLGGSNTLYLNHGVNNLMHDAAARYSRGTLGCTLLHLGGGLKENDSLYKFKRSIGDIQLKWYLGKAVLSKTTFERLVVARATYLGMTPDTLYSSTDFHPVYRKGVVANELETSSKRRPTVYALIGNDQRWPALKSLMKLEMKGHIDLNVFIPYGSKYKKFEKQLALERLTYKSVKKMEFEGLLVSSFPSIVVTCGWPFILTTSLLQQAKSSIFINCHPSLLPKHRGSAPFWAAIMARDEYAGSTVHKTDKGVDTGPILRQELFSIDPFDTYASVKAKSFQAEAKNLHESILTLLEAMPKETSNNANRDLPDLWDEVGRLFQPQKVKEQCGITPRRRPADSEVDPSKSLISLYDHIRTCDQSFPAFFFIHGQKLSNQYSRGGEILFGCIVL
ncbi:unnamed protein product [Cylindrotheca closterium]|uniref:Formyl transferase N-terminal domain-containing protein n=1 Tax=Cylindrotheca closterium TaxID=2856 RepID=A0AAD2G4N4_9STRA|nr:unnamed protein product [Cylindrotheca closterium]